MPKELIKTTIIGTFFGFFFLGLLFYSTGGFRPQTKGNDTTNQGSQKVPSDFTQRDTWMNVFQKDRKIGYTHSRINKLSSTGYRVIQDLQMRLNVMGMVRSITVHADGMLNPDFSLSSFKASISSDVFNFKADGTVLDRTIQITTQNNGSRKTMQIPINGKLYFSAGITDAPAISNLEEGAVFTGEIFDPAAMGAVPFKARMIGSETIDVGGHAYPSKKISFQYKGVEQYAWLSENGEILKEEGLLGIILMRTTREQALAQTPDAPSEDITLSASVPIRHPIQNPEKQSKLRINISGISLEDLDLNGGRQHLDGTVLTIVKEDMAALKAASPGNDPPDDPARFLAPTLFIQSDHPQLEQLVDSIIQPESSPRHNVVRLMNWMAENIEKRPVLSMPDALSTLTNRQGDCNEHAMLMAAMARAAGIPAKIEAGLVYLNGRFFYHAWNLVYVGDWITVDTALDQIPADVTHIRLISGGGGDPLDLLPVIGNIAIEVLEND